MSVHPSITRVFSDETIEHTADILIPSERIVILVFYTNGDWWAVSPSTRNLHSNWPTPSEKHRLQPISAYNIWTIAASVQLSRIGSRSRSSNASAVLGIVILSVCPSVTRVLCDETIELTANILIPHERLIILVLWYQRRLVGDVSFYLKFVLKLTHPPLKSADFNQYLLITSEP